MLRIAEHFHDSDLGRQRQGNEDNLFVRAPLFVVADGMGGAQAGEVASELAVRQFEGGLPDAPPPGEALADLIRQANAEIHRQSGDDPALAGMGTTVTAAYLDGDNLVVAHVGDSRAYLLRDGDLIRLTRDHSLVGELVARGKLTEEQAETHPQRSVITRALGAYPEVEVDTDVFPARAGDLYLLCSDGLTGMVHEPVLKPMLEDRGRSLAQTGRALIAAANEAGGRDNITVILFRLEEVEDRRGGGAGRGDARVRRDRRVRHVRRRAGPARGRRPPPWRTTPPRPSTAGTAPWRCRRSSRRTVQRPRPASHRSAPSRCRTCRASASAAAGPAPCCCSWPSSCPLLVGAWLATRAVYFVGTEPGPAHSVTIYRGLPYELPLGLSLYQTYYESGVPLAQVPAARRARFTDHKLRARDDAEDLVIQLERGQVE